MGSVTSALALVARLEAKRVRATSRSTPSRQMLAVVGAVGQAEREAMLERQREGMPGQNRRGTTTKAVCRPFGDRLPR
jgi:DNA invertase Pin-like site-specific DNA recombinase